MKADFESIDISIRFDGKRFVTSTRSGKRATSKLSAQIAAVRLGHKLFGEHFDHAQPWLKLDPNAPAENWTLQGIREHRSKSPRA